MSYTADEFSAIANEMAKGIDGWRDTSTRMSARETQATVAALRIAARVADGPAIASAVATALAANGIQWMPEGIVRAIREALTRPKEGT